MEIILANIYVIVGREDSGYGEILIFSFCQILSNALFLKPKFKLNNFGSGNWENKNILNSIVSN